MCAPQQQLRKNRVQPLLQDHDTSVEVVDKQERRKHHERKKSKAKNHHKMTKKEELPRTQCHPKNRFTKRFNSQKKKPQNTDKVPEDLALEVQARYLALDCEFVGTGPGGCTSALARVSIVDYNYKILLDTHVKVNDPVTDYRTFVSGITEEHITSDLAMDRAKCIDAVKKILQGKILIGHGLKTDLSVLGIEHPWYDMRDTAKYEPFMKKQSKQESHPSTLPKPRKLKDLAWTKLHRVIQQEGMPHCSIEDAIAALDLYKKARLKWEKVVEYKKQRTAEISQQLQKETMTV